MTEQTDGARALREFLERHGLTQTALSEALGVSKGAASEWLSGAKRPRSHHRRAIELWTGGEVAARLWELEDERVAADGVVPFRTADPDDSGALPAIDLADAS